MRLFYVLLISFIHTTCAWGGIWLVGPSQNFTKPSQVSGLVQSGDTVFIEAAVYPNDVARWTADRLLIRGINGRAHLKCGGNVYGGKAIWVIVGDDVTVENIEFSEATCPDRNGAGIRSEGINLTIRHCYFHHNEDGILAGDIASGDFLIEYSEFAYNGYPDGLAHNLYINHANSLTFQFNYSHDALVGHELKSRAYHNYIYNNRFSDEAGTASRSIDLPNGGFTIIMGNIIVQDQFSENSNLVGYGLEGLNNPNSALYITHNTFVNNKSNGSFVQFPATDVTVKIWNNIFAGPGTVISGVASQLDTLGNLVAPITSIGFVDHPGYDFNLEQQSPAIGLAHPPGFANGLPLAPVFEYLHPSNRQPRANATDAGAFGFQSSVSNTIALERPGIRFFPNPTTGIIHLEGLATTAGSRLFDAQGRWLEDLPAAQTIDMRHLPAGVYFLVVLTDTSQSGLKFVKW